ncbi:hypothetical protein [Cedecea sp. VD20]|uniref:hypothetical protein n=1 Tax=Cedecea sp. VD20 TaxID=3081241 RepID=UPI00301A5E33
MLQTRPSKSTSLSSSLIATGWPPERFATRILVSHNPALRVLIFAGRGMMQKHSRAETASKAAEKQLMPSIEVKGSVFSD